MARNANHVTDHNELVALLDEQAARFGYTKVSGGPFNENDPAHIDQHNLMVTDLKGLASLAGQSFTTELPPVANRGDAGHPKDHDAIRSALAEVAGWAAWNAASGGLEQSFGNYNGTGERWMVHTFTGNGTFTVTRGVQPFRVLVVAGGGGGGSWNYGCGGGGAGGMVANDAQTLPEGALSVVVGAGGGVSSGASVGYYGRDGGNSSLDSITATGGGGGSGPYDNGRNGGSGGGTYLVDGHGKTRGEGIAGQGHPGGGTTGGSWAGANGTGGGGGAGGPGDKNGKQGVGAYSNITGTNTKYAQGGKGRTSSSNPVPAADSFAGSGGYGGGSWDGPGNAQGTAGRKGVVVVAYRIG